ncbi:hypothetical protein SAMN05216428_11415 [Nitrosospira sp. Nsp11]|uniref:hypothetical protein n=1 Tax=Nitrosospira sp. Nsp11 TaxID=1855338 RepID=UPI00091BE50E|nr:hypothetical protein [Nitrosospira sp. Nsp11]SHM11012.1 hypothetical protein SAMN05216428_11415 [Nitrosospira sp. Nsp11]
MYVLIGIFLGGLTLGGLVSWKVTADHFEAGMLKEQRQEIKIVAKRDDVTAVSGTQAVAAQEKIRTVFRDRTIYRDREVPVEVIKRMDSGCVIPNHFVSMWNSANQGTVPDATSGIDETASDVRLTDIEWQKEREAEICLANTEQLIGLQGWIKGQKAVE